MPYVQVSPGVYQRPVGDNENFFIIVANTTIPIGREHWSIPFYLKIQARGSLATNLQDQLRQAWRLMRFRHPSIAARLKDNSKLEYVVPDEQILAAWEQESFFVVPGKSRQDVTASLPPELYMTLRFLPDSNEIIFHSSHWHSDGIGVLHLMDDFVELLVSDASDSKPISWGNEISRLAISNEEAYGMPSEPTEQITKTAAKFSESFKLIPGAVGINYVPKAEVPGGVWDATIFFSEQETSNVVEKCKALGVSVTSSVHASLAVSTWTFAAPENKGKHYTSTIRLNMRPQLPEPYSTRAYAAGEATTGFMVAVQPSQSWLKIAQTYNELYRQGIPEGFLEAHRRYGKEILEFMGSVDPGAPPASDGDISSLGRIDDIIKPSRGDASRSIQVLDLGVGAEHSTPQLDLFVWTFRGCLKLYNMYNENFHEASDVMAFTAHVKMVLLQQLQLA